MLRFHLVSDWSRNNKHSINFLWRSRFYGNDCNSPRSKFSKQRGERRREVNLPSDNIPGVSVSEEKIEKLTPSQLKFSLQNNWESIKSDNVGNSQ